MLLEQKVRNQFKIYGDCVSVLFKSPLATVKCVAVFDLLIYFVSYHSLVFMKILRFFQFLFVAVLLRWFFLNS